MLMLQPLGVEGIDRSGRIVAIMTFGMSPCVSLGARLGYKCSRFITVIASVPKACYGRTVLTANPELAVLHFVHKFELQLDS